MYSLRYGTIPIVRHTGGLADTVIPHTREDGNGVVFDHFDSTGVRWAIETALELYGQPGKWAQMIASGMSRDFSWGQQVGHYVDLFESLQQSA